MSGRTMVQFDRRKFREAVLHICEIGGTARLGAIKLHKALYFADMIRYATTGAPLTGATYRKRPLGPTADYLLSALKDLASEGRLEVRTDNYFGYAKRTYIPLQPANTSVFDMDELALLKEVTGFVCGQTAKEISEFSHNAAWEAAQMGDELPYYTAYALFPSQVSIEAIEWAEGAAAGVEDERSKGHSADYPTFADFRSRVLATGR